MRNLPGLHNPDISLSLKQLLKQADADAETKLVHMSYVNKLFKEETVPNHKLIVLDKKDEDYIPLEVVKNRYEIIPNKVLLYLAIKLIQAYSSFSLNHIGCYDNGRKFFVIVKTGEMELATEVVESYLVFLTSHDGTHGSMYYPLYYLKMHGMFFSMSEHFVSIKHTPNWEDSIGSAEGIFEKRNFWISEFMDRWYSWKDIECDNTSLIRFAHSCFSLRGTSEKQAKTRDERVEGCVRRFNLLAQTFGFNLFSSYAAICWELDEGIKPDCPIRHLLEHGNWSNRKKRSLAIGTWLEYEDATGL